MAKKFMQTVLTPAVLDAQDKYYGRRANVPDAPTPDVLGDEEKMFIETRDSFYMATISESGWPYIQHRGGAAGFLKVTGPSSLVFSDYAGNRQMLSTGNLSANDRVSLFLMDYPNRERLKILGHARVEAAQKEGESGRHLSQVKEEGPVERIITIEVLAFDWNCPKYITPRFTEEEIKSVTDPLVKRISELEARLAAHNE